MIPIKRTKFDKAYLRVCPVEEDGLTFVALKIEDTSAKKKKKSKK
jgi:hypothetical protein